MQRKRLLVLLCGVVVVVSSSAAYLCLRSAKPVNILLITLDTTRADRLGCYDYEPAETLHLDALAKRGVLFERAYAPAPMTSPSHTSMLTGLWPPEHGVFTNGQFSLDSGIPTVAELLTKRGYANAAFLAAFVLQAKFGLNRGFPVYDDDLSTAEPGQDQLHRSRDGRFVIDSAIGWLKKHHQERSHIPFFCWVHLYDAHEPYLAHPQEFGDKFSERLYDGELAYTDRQVGRLLDLLEKLGMTADTVIFVAGDHGESLGEHGELTHGYMLHDSTLRVPLIITDPRVKTAGRRVSTPVSLLDLFSTLLETAGASLPKESKNRSLRPALEGRPLEPRFCYSQTDEPYLQAFWSPLRGMTTDRWRYVRTTKPELYDLRADPHELINLADELPDTIRELDAELAGFEGKFKGRAGAQVALTAREQRSLESLGYTGGSSNGTKRPGGDEPLPDIKDMIDSLNRLDQAVDLLEERKYDEAAAMLEPLARGVPNFFRARLNLGLCRLQQERYDDAVRWLDAALQVDPNSDRALDMLGFVYLKLRKLDLAEKYFRQLLELSPDSENAYLYLGEIQQRHGRLDLARQHYAACLHINPQNAAARNALRALSDR